jgi:hypothetical protein
LTKKEAARHQGVSSDSSATSSCGNDADTTITTTTATTMTSTTQEIFSSKGHNMQYFDAEGIKQRTGYANELDWYLMVIKELFDNAVDFLQANYKGATDAKIIAAITISKVSSKVNYKVRNTNPKNVLVRAFQTENLKNILNFDMSYGSKQNEHVIRRGLFGDATKLIAALSYVLMHMSEDGSAFFDSQWETPMYFRANGIEHRVLIEVDKAASMTRTQIAQSTPNKMPHTTTSVTTTTTDTEVEVTLPLISSVLSSFDVNQLNRKIEEYCRRYPLFTPDISFKIDLVDNREGNNKKEEETIIVPLTSINIAAARAISQERKISSILSYTPEEFVKVLTGIHDRENITLYDVIRKFKEGTQIPKREFDNIVSVKDVNKLSIAEFLQHDPEDYQTKTRALYYRLRAKAEGS